MILTQRGMYQQVQGLLCAHGSEHTNKYAQREH